MVTPTRQSLPGERWQYLDRFVVEIVVFGNCFAGKIVQDLTPEQTWEIGHIVGDPEVYIHSCTKLEGQENPAVR